MRVSIQIVEGLVRLKPPSYWRKPGRIKRLKACRNMTFLLPLYSMGTLYVAKLNAMLLFLFFFFVGKIDLPSDHDSSLA